MAMKKTMLCLCLLVCLMLCACGGAPGLVGTWQHDAAPITYEFRQDGTISLTTESREPIEGTYAVDEESRQLTIEYDGFETVVTYTLEGNTLTCVDYNGAVVTLTRVQ